MCDTIQHTEIQLNAVSARNYDPTRTTTLRNAFARAMRKRFRRLRGVIRKAIVEDDVFGLIDIQANEMTSPGADRFNFPRTTEKVSAFMSWLRRMEEEGILEMADITRAGESAESAWTNKYILDSYKRGVQRARYELAQAGFDVPSMEATGGLDVAMGTPFHADRVGLLYTRVFNELKGITDAMDQQISRVLSQGMIDGDNPRLLARKINAVISGQGMGELGLTDTLGRFIPAERRATIMARTEIIRAHAEASLNEYENWTEEGVVLKAEWITAEDNRVCDRCASREGQVMKISEARGLIPLHPQCRCAWLPYRANVVTKKGIR